MGGSPWWLSSVMSHTCGTFVFFLMPPLLYALAEPKRSSAGKTTEELALATVCCVAGAAVYALGAAATVSSVPQGIT